MLLEGTFVNDILMNDEIRPYPPAPQETSGVNLGSESIYRYALKESDYPTLTLDEPLYSASGDAIPPGHYELALSDTRDFLILVESKEARAVIPVFKVEDDGAAAYREQVNKQKNKRAMKKEAKEVAKTNKARAKVGMPPVTDSVYMKATIEYVQKGGYYLLMYERGNIRAWGAIKG
jgi:hypothetical protein